MSDATLPQPLQPWRPWLDWFAPHLAPQVGELLLRLHPLLGRFRGHRPGAEPEPDGLGDLRRRGPYERLLATEWLLADELPDEFLRRAAANEHLFLAPRPRTRRAERLIVALFDAGPLQLGAPRLAHLAMWILLARRAAAAGGELRCGLLQAPGPLHDATSVSRLQQLLEARTFTLASPSHWQQWQQAIADQRMAMGECWLVGPDLLEAPQRGLASHQLAIRRAPAGDLLEVKLAEHAAKRSLALALPAAAVAVPLLQGRFLQPTPERLNQSSTHRLSLQRPPLIAPGGQLVAVPDLDEPGMLVFRTTQAKGSKPPKKYRWARGADPLACAFNGKQLGALIAEATHLYFWQMPKFGARSRPGREVFEAPPGLARHLPAAWGRQGGKEALVLIDRAGRLLRFLAQPAEGPECIDTGVLALAKTHAESVVYVVSRAGQVWLREIVGLGAATVARHLGVAPKDEPRVLLGMGGWRQGAGVCAVRMERAPRELWALFISRRGHTAFAQEQVSLASGLSGLAVLLHLPSMRYGIVALADNRSSLYWCTSAGQAPELLYTAPARIAQWSACPLSGVIALLTHEKHLVVYDAAQRQVRLLVHGASAEADDVAA